MTEIKKDNREQVNRPAPIVAGLDIPIMYLSWSWDAVR